jgi:anaerobic selenocysteine-containing dehydrogenase
MLDHGTIAVVDPKLHSSAVKAHEWLPIKPGEDGALASAIAHVLLTEGLWNKEFVGDFKDGKNPFPGRKDG